MCIFCVQIEAERERERERERKREREHRTQKHSNLLTCFMKIKPATLDH